MDVNGFVKKAPSTYVISPSVPSSVCAVEGPYKHWFERAIVTNLDDDQDNKVEDNIDIESPADVTTPILPSPPTLASAPKVTVTPTAVTPVTVTPTAVAPVTVTPNTRKIFIDIMFVKKHLKILSIQILIPTLCLLYMMVLFSN